MLRHLPIHRGSAPHSRSYSPLKVLACIAQHLELARLVPEAAHPQAAHDMIHALPARLVVMEKVATMQDHVDVVLLGQHHNFVERLPAVVAANGVALVVPDMAVRRDQDADRIWVIGVVQACRRYVCEPRSLVGLFVV